MGAAKSHSLQRENDFFVHAGRSISRPRRLEPRVVLRRLAELSLAKVHGAFDVCAAERLLGPEVIVRSATDTKVLGVRATAEGVRDDVIELEERRRFATVAVGGNVRATAAVVFENEPADRNRNVP